MLKISTNGKILLFQKTPKKNKETTIQSKTASFMLLLVDALKSESKDAYLNCVCFEC
jgi:hypothetical protein